MTKTDSVVAEQRESDKAMSGAWDCGCVPVDKIKCAMHSGNEEQNLGVLTNSDEAKVELLLVERRSAMITEQMKQKANLLVQRWAAQGSFTAVFPPEAVGLVLLIAEALADARDAGLREAAEIAKDFDELVNGKVIAAIIEARIAAPPEGNQDVERMKVALIDRVKEIWIASGAKPETMQRIVDELGKVEIK